VLPGRMQVRIRPQVWTSEQIKEIEYAQRELTRIKASTHADRIACSLVEVRQDARQHWPMRRRLPWSKTPIHPNLDGWSDAFGIFAQRLLLHRCSKIVRRNGVG